MAVLAKWLADISGKIATGGTSVAYTVTTNSAFDTLAHLDGQFVSFSPNATNGTPCTLNVDGLGAKPLRSAPGIELAAGVLASGSPYSALYNNSAGEFYLINFYITPGITVNAAAMTASAQGFNAPLNLRLSASVAANAITVAIKGADGTDPSASNPVLIGFRDATIANGDMVVRSLQAALSFTVSAGNTMGASNAVPFRLWVVAFDNSGTVCLALVKASSTTQIFALNEAARQSSAAGTGGGSSAGTFYANASSITNMPIRILGYMDWPTGLTTAGTWNAAPTTIQLFGPGIKKPGDVIQSIYTTTTSTTSLSSATLSATSLAQAITLTAAMNLIKVNAQGFAQTNVNGVMFQLGRNSTSNMIGNVSSNNNGSTFGTIACLAVDAPGTASSATYTLYGALNTGSSTATWLSVTNKGNFTPQGSMTVEELMG